MDVHDVLQVPDGAAGGYISARVAEDVASLRGGHGRNDGEDCDGDRFEVRELYKSRERTTAP